MGRRQRDTRGSLRLGSVWPLQETLGDGRDVAPPGRLDLTGQQAELLADPGSGGLGTIEIPGGRREGAEIDLEALPSHAQWFRGAEARPAGHEGLE